MHRWNATEGRGFLKNKITDKLISAVVNEFATEFESFVLSSLKKYQQFSHVWVLGPRPMTLKNLHFSKHIKKTLDKWKGSVFAEYFQNLLYTCLWTGLTFLVYLEYMKAGYLVIIFDCTWGLVWETVVWKVKHIILYSQRLSNKTVA